MKIFSVQNGTSNLPTTSKMIINPRMDTLKSTSSKKLMTTASQPNPLTPVITTSKSLNNKSKTSVTATSRQWTNEHETSIISSSKISTSYAETPVFTTSKESTNIGKTSIFTTSKSLNQKIYAKC